jgi:glycosyltransferase involved in cell wall biosynthesis
MQENNDKLKILTYTTLFPNNTNPNFGVFIRERIRFMAEVMNLKVVAPVPFFPSININKKWYSYSQVHKFENQNGIEVFHPVYFMIPKFFMSIYGYFLYISTIGLLKKIKEYYDFKLIDSHYAYPDGYASVLLGKNLGVPVTVTVRGTDINLFPTFPRIRKKIIHALNQASKIISVSQALKDKIIDMGIPESKIHVIRNGVDTSVFFPVQSVRDEMDLPKGRKIVLSIGNIIETKGFQLLIKSIDIIKTSQKPPLLVIIGNGPYKNVLEDLVTTLDLNNDVLFAGPKPHGTLFKWYNACDVFCLASFREGIPNVILEAFACGKPVVATAVGGIPEIVTSDNGFMVPELSAEKIASAIVKSLNAEWNREKIIEYAKTFAWDVTGKNLFSLFQSIIMKSGIIR